MQPGRMRRPGVVARAAMGMRPMSAVSGGEARGAFGGRHAVDLVAEGERGVERRMLEVPHEGRGVEEADGGDAQTGWGGRSHSS